MGGSTSGLKVPWVDLKFYHAEGLVFGLGPIQKYWQGPIVHLNIFSELLLQTILICITLW